MMETTEMVGVEKAQSVIDLHEAAVTGTKDITVAVTTLAAHAPALARTVIALHAIMEGRTVAPTDAEIAAHDDAGGSWLVQRDDGYAAVIDARDALRVMHSEARQRVVRWWPLASDGRPCAWPETEVRDGR